MHRSVPSISVSIRDSPSKFFKDRSHIKQYFKIYDIIQSPIAPPTYVDAMTKVEDFIS